MFCGKTALVAHSGVADKPLRSHGSGEVVWNPLIMCGAHGILHIAHTYSYLKDVFYDRGSTSPLKTFLGVGTP